ncbi:hypothetical protein E2C01_010308 [Portunus trituberculatus]|uniref:Uncharacterized protein n=1 Tax=Portunus trituberculatus TaxID=210409 RepID=A0A5B7D805_PORTR|nr:hypothetical protein [Portunus trituberculatus]
MVTDGDERLTAPQHSTSENCALPRGMQGQNSGRAATAQHGKTRSNTFLHSTTLTLHALYFHQHSQIT